MMGVIASPIYHNEGKFRLRKYLGKKRYYSKNFDKYVQKWGKHDPEIKNNSESGTGYQVFL